MARTPDQTPAPHPTGQSLDPADTRSPGDTRDAADRELLLSEERLRVGTATDEIGKVRAVKSVETHTAVERVPRGIEQAEVERADAAEADSGQVETLPDGSLSIPVFEERIFVEKRLVVRERVIVRKHTVYEEQEITAELRRERLDISTEGDVRVVDDGAVPPTGA